MGSVTHMLSHEALILTEVVGMLHYVCSSFTMWSVQLIALPRLQELLNFMSSFAPTISSTTANFSDWPRLSCLPQLILGSCTNSVHSFSFDNAVYDSCGRLYGLHFVFSEDNTTQFSWLKSTLNRVSLPTDHLGRRIGEAYVHVTDTNDHRSILWHSRTQHKVEQYMQTG